jgi:hypothetical protein
MLEMIVAPAGGAGAPPLLLGGRVEGVEGDVGVDGVLPELGDPDVPDPANCVVVLAEEDLAFETPHPVIEKIPIDNVPMAQNPFRFNCIKDLSVGGGADCQVKVGEHLLWIYPARHVGGLKNSP